MRAWLRTRKAWWALRALGLLPLMWLVWRTLADQLGANPAETLIRATGDWTLRGLCLALAITPLRTMLGWPELARFRRMTGLLSFGYASLHLLCYAWFDMGLDASDIAADIVKRPVWRPRVSVQLNLMAALLRPVSAVLAAAVAVQQGQMVRAVPVLELRAVRAIMALAEPAALPPTPQTTAATALNTQRRIHGTALHIPARRPRAAQAAAVVVSTVPLQVLVAQAETMARAAAVRVALAPPAV